MGQQEVMDFLKKKGWVSIQEIIDAMECNPVNVSRAVNTLVVHKEVERYKIPFRRHEYLYRRARGKR